MGNAMELDRAEKPLRQLRKLLMRMAKNPAPAEVHKLRTRARKVEAIAGALGVADERATERLLKAIKPIRKAAGAVRDMDVLAGDLLAIPRKEIDQSLVKLEEHLDATRRASADNLTAVIDAKRKKAEKHLKNFARLLDLRANGKKPVRCAEAQRRDSETGSESRADRLMDELTRWPVLNQNNLHAFRLKVKELCYVLQLYPEASKRLTDAFGKVKDQIGEWHDWEQLLEIAQKVLDAQADHDLLQHIEATGRRKFMQALAGANTLRQRYLMGALARRAVS